MVLSIKSYRSSIPPLAHSQANPLPMPRIVNWAHYPLTTLPAVGPPAPKPDQLEGCWPVRCKYDGQSWKFLTREMKNTNFLASPNYPSFSHLSLQHAFIHCNINKHIRRLYVQLVSTNIEMYKKAQTLTQQGWTRCRTPPVCRRQDIQTAQRRGKWRQTWQ